jgi:hypothetical protein
MSPDSQVTDGDSGETPAVDNTANESQPTDSNKVGSGEPSQEPVSTDAPISPASAPRKSDAKADGKTKSKAKEEVQPAVTPKAQGPKSLAEVMKVDLRVRKGFRR